MSSDQSVTGQELMELDFCEEMSVADRNQLAALMTRATVDAGRTIFRGGEPATAIYLLQEGRVAVEICAAGVGCRTVVTTGPGELLGWSPLIEGTHYTATARALTPVRLLRIDGQQLRSVCDRDPALGYRVLRQVVRTMAIRLDASRLQMLDLYGPAGPMATEPATGEMPAQ